MSVKRYEWVACDEHACHCDVVESAEGDMVNYEDYAALEARFAALAEENAGLKKFCKDAAFDADYEAELGMERGGFTDALNNIKTPATGAFLAEVRAQARNEGINYAASRLAAAFNHGFVDKPLAEVFDVVRMILDTKEELANSALPAADGLSGEYAEEFLEDSTVQLHKGGEHDERQSFLSDEDRHAFVKAFTKGAAQ
ncbi:hypothetical protein [Enterobacter asburiae]|uniref:hypothetical protein n=1 Tax=Enterobacter asburiae TaxID=61645 RepID=UPI002456602A|nr:hypothetical protein [Enterobacter asburiae]MDH5022402.1 hypothetical protein [Enterobacter asburiae]